MKFCVIGVGRFGYQVATTLAEHGMEVLAVDSSETTIASIRDKVTQAICMSVSDEEALRSIGIEEIGTVIVAMGENFAQSILVTALLKQKLKVPLVIARSISQIHKEILQLIGADQVVLPEQEMGRRLADNLSLPFNSLLRVTSHFSISQIKIPQRFVGKTTKELRLFGNYHVYAIGYKKDDEVLPLEPSYRFNADDVLLCAGLNDDLAKIAKLL
ncbi:MAG: TrkA family potassium uptake protein [Candidatus Babeliaceae bacterium]